MNFFKRYAIPLNLLVIAVTIVFVGAALVVGAHADRHHRPDPELVGVDAALAKELAQGAGDDRQPSEFESGRGQGLVGGAELSVGAWVFLMCIFAGGWMAAWFVRKQWI